MLVIIVNVHNLEYRTFAEILDVWR